MSEEHRQAVADDDATDSGQRPLRVLLAEDNESNTLLARTIMEMLGCEVVAVGTGRLAVSAVQRERFDVILMDFHMPAMDGLEATREIRRIEAQAGTREHIPIVAITASAMESERQECLRSGMDDVLVKPFRPDDLRQLLKKWS
jgi:CheY-like chemotaxis protein